MTEPHLSLSPITAAPAGSTDHSDSATTTQKPRPKRWLRRILVTILATFTGLILLTVIAAYVFTWHARRGMGATAVANLEQFLNSQVEIPAEMLNPRPFTDEAKTAAIELARQNLLLEDKRFGRVSPGHRPPRDQVEELPEFSAATEFVYRLARGERLDDAEWTSVTTLLAESDELLTAARAVNRIPSWDLEVCFDLEIPISSSEARSLKNVQQAIRLLAYREAREDRFDSAAAEEISFLALLRTSRRPNLISQLVRASFLQGVSRDLVQFAPKLTSTALVNRAISQLGLPEFAEPLIKLLPDRRAQTFVEMIREYERIGVPVRLQHIQTGRDAVDLLLVATELHDQISRGAAVSFPLEEFRDRGAGLYLPPGRQQSGFYHFWKLFKYSSYINDTFRIGIYGPMQVPSREEAETRGNVATVWMRLAVKSLAARARELGETPTLPPDVEKDPFTTRVLLTAPSGLRYSIGPDQQDDHATIQYDPANRTISAGDIFAPGP